MRHITLKKVSIVAFAVHASWLLLSALHQQHAGTVIGRSGTT